MSDADFADEADWLSISRLLQVGLAIILGVLLGLAYTMNSLDLDRRGIAVGPWRSTPRDTTGDSDPYALAADARASLLPLGAAEGLSFTAAVDEDGVALESRCDYAVTGPLPAARAWTLSLLDQRGFPVANAADRYGFTSSEVLRLAGEPLTIAVATQARSGNWLPIGSVRDFKLMLRLYDTTLTAAGSELGKIAMPRIQRLSCR